MPEKLSVIMQDFMNYVNKIDTENYVRNILFCFAAPTILGIKSACMINFKRGNDNICSIWKANADSWLKNLNIEWLLLNEFNKSNNALVLIYRRELLKEILNSSEAREILKARDYPLPDVDRCLECLKNKFCCCEKCEMPHEVGIFLNYPPEDVKGFIENRNAKNKSSANLSYWKVYGDAVKARKTFEQYKRAECEAALLMLACVNGQKNIKH